MAHQIHHRSPGPHHNTSYLECSDHCDKITATRNSWLGGMLLLGLKQFLISTSVSSSVLSNEINKTLQTLLNFHLFRGKTIY